jgi:ABC-type sugar transport system permease subunit
MILYMSALGSVRRELHEAAAVDGANTIQRFWNVTVPGVSRTMLLIAVLVAVSAMRIFSELFILGGAQGGANGKDVTLVMLAQSAATGIDGRIGYAGAISIFLFLMTIGPLLLLTRLNRNANEVES